jgi:hypothetical protein
VGFIAKVRRSHANQRICTSSLLHNIRKPLNIQVIDFKSPLRDSFTDFIAKAVCCHVAHSTRTSSLLSNNTLFGGITGFWKSTRTIRA